MVNVDDVIKQIRIVNPKRDRSSITEFKGMYDFLKFVDLPDNFADLLRHLWPVVQDKSKEIQGRLSKPGQSIEAYHELIIGYSLFDHCKNNSLTLEFSPKIENKTPDWVVSDSKQKLIIEVVTTDKSNHQSAFEACIGLIDSLVKEGLKRNGMDTTLYYNTSSFVIPAYRGRLNKEEQAKQEDRFTDFCREVSKRIITIVMCGYGRDKNERDKSGLEFRVGSGVSSRTTTRGHKTYRVVNSILSKGKAYKELSKLIPIIVAVVNNHENRSEAYSPSEIAKLLYYPDTVNEPQFSRITDKDKHVMNIKDSIEGLNVLEGILFYKIDLSSIYTTCYEYFPNPHKATKWEIPDRFKSYLEGSSNECKKRNETSFS